jgi:hypothetical protein
MASWRRYNVAAIAALVGLAEDEVQEMLRTE